MQTASPTVSASNNYRKLIQSIPESAPPVLSNLSRDPVTWTTQSRILKGMPFSFQDRDYLHQLYRETSPEVYIVKGRQTEMTEKLANLMVCNAFLHPGTISLFMSSTWDKTRTFSNLRIHDMALKVSPIWQQIIPPKNHFTTQSTLTNGSKLYYRSAFNKYEEARTFPVDFLYLDEMQSQEVEHIDVAIEAMSHSRHKRLIGVGTGDYEETQWYRRWHMGTQFKWDIKSQSWIAEHEGDPLIHSYHIPQTIVPWITDAEIERKFNAAQSRNQATMEILGWWVTGVQKPITESMVRDNFDANISMVNPDSINITKLKKSGPIFVGIDWGGGNRAHTVAWFVQAINEDIPIMRLLYTTVIDDPDVEVQADKAIRLIEAFEPDLGVMDQGGGTRQVQKVENRFAELIHKCWYSTDTERPLNLDKLYTENLAKVNRTISIDGIIDLLSRPHVFPKSRTPTPRYQFPAKDPRKIEWIIRHFTSITAKSMKMASGQEYVKYDKEPTDVHDALMACNYANIAFQIWNESRGGMFVVGSFGGQI